jgi:hypothetical protein
MPLTVVTKMWSILNPKGEHVFMYSGGFNKSMETVEKCVYNWVVNQIFHIDLSINNDYDQCCNSSFGF